MKQILLVLVIIIAFVAVNMMIKAQCKKDNEDNKEKFYNMRERYPYSCGNYADHDLEKCDCGWRHSIFDKTHDHKNLYNLTPWYREPYDYYMWEDTVRRHRRWNKMHRRSYLNIDGHMY